MLRSATVAMTGLVMLALVAHADPALAQIGPTVQFVTLASGKTSGVHEPTQLVIREQAAWRALWRRHAGPTVLPVPDVDFTREMVVAIFAGESQAPRALSIRRITRESAGLVVSYALGETRPVLETEGLPRSNAFAIVRLPASPLPVRFVQVKTMPVVRAP